MRFFGEGDFGTLCRLFVLIEAFQCHTVVVDTVDGPMVDDET